MYAWDEKVEVKDVGGENPTGENRVEIEMGAFVDGECHTGAFSAVMRPS
jgi:hypothetical protein